MNGLRYDIFVWKVCYLIVFHLCIRAFPREPKVLSQRKEEKKCFSDVEQAMGEEKYE